MSFSTNFKPSKGTAKAERRARTNAARRVEKNGKIDVRKRDPRCRFPLCGCRKFGYALHVSHLRHKGMGGDVTGKRSAPALMVRVCAPRHREARVSIDRGTVRWEALTPDGANGPIVWYIDAGALPEPMRPLPIQQGEIELARERAPYQYEHMGPWQIQVLRELAQMYC